MTDQNTPKEMKAIKGRLSFNKLTALEAYEEAITGPFAANVKTIGDAAPYATLLLTQTQYDRIMAKIVDEFLPFCAAQYKISDKEKNALSPADIKGLTAQLEAGTGPYNTPFKQPSDKTLELMPDCVASIKLIGQKGKDFDVQAIVKKDDELAVPDPDRIIPPAVVLPIGETKHQLYNGCWVIAPLRFYSYKNGKNPGFSAGGGSLVFSRDDAPFSGGGAIDSDSIFAADDED
jgi:hypothetical protein